MRKVGESVENITLAIQAAQPAMSLTPENREESDRQIDIPVESPEEELATFEDELGTFTNDTEKVWEGKPNE